MDLLPSWRLALNPRIRIAVFAAAAFLSLPLGAADDPSLDQLAARASDLVAANKLDEAEKLADQALETKKDFAPALVQKARVELARGNDTRDSLVKANLMLWRAVESDPTYAPTYILMVHIQEKLGTHTIDPRQWYYRASKQRSNDEPWLVPYHLEYAEKYDPSQVDKYREMLVNAGGADPKMAFEVHHKKFQGHLYHGEREQAHTEYVALLRMQPDNAFIPGDYSRGLMMFFQDFDAGERYAREALAITDYPHARQSLSLALYGKWVTAKREGRDPQEVRALLAAAEKNDPGARNVPDCALAFPPMRFVADGIDGLGNVRRRDPTEHNC
jgi:Tfp pilus assembly protein PilF